ASAAAIDALAESFFGAQAGSMAPSEALAAAIRGANDAVLGAAGKSGQPGAASTLVAAAIDGSSAVIGNLGDSRAYLLRGGDIRLVNLILALLVAVVVVGAVAALVFANGVYPIAR